MRLPHFDRLDFLATKILLALVCVTMSVLSVGWPLVRWLRNQPLHWSLDGLGSTDVPSRLGPGDGVQLRGAETIAVRIENAGAGPWLASLLPGVALSVAVGLAVWLLLRLVQRIEQGRPFVVASSVALRLLGATILLGSLAVSLGLGIADAVIAQRALDGANPSFGIDLPFLPFVSALVVLALAEVFAQGARLQEDVEGLV